MAARHNARFFATAIFSIFILLTSAWRGRADEIEMVNGDRYVGQLVVVGADTITVQSEVLGTLKLPREKVAGITFRRPQSNHSTNALSSQPLLLRSNTTPRAQATLRTNLNGDLTGVMRQLSQSSNLVQQVQQQILGGAGPEAQAKFNDLLSGLLTGKLDMNGLRLEAKSTLAQARNARKELGDDAGSGLDSYLSILDGFLKETEPAAPATNSPASIPAPKAP